MTETKQNDGVPIYQQTQRVAGEVERNVAGVTVDVSRNEITINFGESFNLPPEAADIVQENGFELHAIFGKSAKFRQKEA